MALLVVAGAAPLVAAAAAPRGEDIAAARSIVRDAVREYHSGAALAPSAFVDGRASAGAVSAVRAAGVERLRALMTGTAFETYAKNLDAVLALESGGSDEVVNRGEVDQLLLDQFDVTIMGATAKGRIHGFTEYRDVHSDRLSRAQSWEYFDADLVRVDGRWLISSLRVIPTLDDSPNGVAPYPAEGDPAG